jgi:hypothetical protein
VNRGWLVSEQQRRRASVDRIEDGKYAVLIADDNREIVIPATDLPEGVEGGMWIQFDEVEGNLTNIEIDEEAQAEARDRIGLKMEELRKRGRKRNE